MNTIEHLEKRLQQEVPAFSWHCSRSAASNSVNGHSETIEIQVTHKGRDLLLSPLSVNEKLVERWGLESAADHVFKEFSFIFSRNARYSAGADWDKLSEI